MAPPGDLDVFGDYLGLAFIFLGVFEVFDAAFYYATGAFTQVTAAELRETSEGDDADEGDGFLKVVLAVAEFAVDGQDEFHYRVVGTGIKKF
jgi:hypothetical protein